MARDYPTSEVLDIIDDVARRRGINRDDFFRFAYIETGGTFDETANRGPNSAKGLFQFVPATARAYGIEGRELDPRANTEAAAQLYLDNRQVLLNRHAANGLDYLSGKQAPDGLDMYVAHQQGANGYRSIQKAIAGGTFEREDTRGKILNNISSRDLETITGVGHRDLAGLSDRELATTYVRYWDVKFDRISIPEKGIAPLVDGAARQPAMPPAGGRAVAGGITLESAHALTLQYDHVKYGLGAKNPELGKVDCSGWVVKLQNAGMDEINRKAGRDVFAPGDRFSPGYDGAAMIVEKAHKRSGMLLEGGEVSAAALREGMIIGEDNGPKSWDAGRYKGIDHIVMVVRDPGDGQLKVSQSRGGEGVELSSLDSYLAGKQRRGVSLYATDPLYKARELIQGREPVAPAHKTATPAAEGTAPAAAAVLQQRDRGQAVAGLQASLAALGYTDPSGRPLAADRIFGPDTERAVRGFQHDMGLQVDGKVGPQTRQALEQVRGQVLLNDPQHPQHALFAQARQQLADLQPSPYGGDPARLDRAAAHVAMDAHGSGLQRIDHLRLSADGRSLFAVQGALDDPAMRRSHVPTAQADDHSLLESTRSLEANARQLQAPVQEQQAREQAVAGIAR